MNEQLWWYVSRAGGLVAGVLLVASLVWGVLMATRVLKPLDRPPWMLAMHRWFSALAVVGVALHLVGLVADDYVHFGWAEVLVPMASDWKPGAVAYGVVAMYVLIAVQVSSLMMRRLSKQVWRGIHMTSYAAVWLGFVHAGTAGTDVTNRVYRIVAMVLALAAVAAAILRLLVGRPAAARPASGRASATRAATPQPVDG